MITRIGRIGEWTFPERAEQVPARSETVETAERALRLETSAPVTPEEIRLVQRVFAPPGLGPRRAVLFAGLEPDDGCAHLCLRAGHALARWIRQPVCVVDADVRAPRLHRLAGADAEQGLADAMAGAASPSSFVRRLASDHLWLLAAGAAPDADSLLMPDRAAACLQELSARFAHLLISVSAVDMWTEALAASGGVDGVVLVLTAHVTRREIARDAKTRLDSVGAPIVGAVLNDRTFPIPEPIYRAI